MSEWNQTQIIFIAIVHKYIHRYCTQVYQRIITYLNTSNASVECFLPMNLTTIISCIPFQELHCWQLDDPPAGLHDVLRRCDLDLIDMEVFGLDKLREASLPWMIITLPIASHLLQPIHRLVEIGRNIGGAKLNRLSHGHGIRGGQGIVGQSRDIAETA